MTRYLVLAIALILAACTSVKPVAIQSTDTCYRCERPISQARLAGEVVDQQGNVKKFRTVWCMASYLNEHPTRGAIYVTDYSSGTLIRAGSATFVRAVIDPVTRERDYLAFQSVVDATAAAGIKSAIPVDWLAIMRFAGAETVVR